MDPEVLRSSYFLLTVVATWVAGEGLVEENFIMFISKVSFLFEIIEVPDVSTSYFLFRWNNADEGYSLLTLTLNQIL